MKQIQIEARKQDLIFDQEWNKMLIMISQDININEFYEKFLKKQGGPGD
jgi:hypothetical protein